MDKEEIREHYNNILEKGRCHREQSTAINIRKVNNFIKACLIRKYVKKGDSVLDLGCGKGGDLPKYQKAGISEYHGVDVADVSINDAKVRLKDMRCRFRTTFDVFDSYNEVMSLQKQFDVISSQFSFHYAFSSCESFKIAARNVATHLKLGGYFILTIPSKEAIVEKYKAGKLSNEFYRIEIDVGDGSIEDQRKYRFTLIDSVNSCVEYFVDFPRMQEEFKGLGLELLRRTNFVKFYKECLKTDPDVSRRMRVMDITEKEMDVVGIYEVVAFQRV